jgi:DNA-binding MarR family transcriptional regulator
LNSKTDKAIDAIARDCIAVRVRLLNRVITNLFDDALRPLGLKVSQLNILVVAAKLGLARPGVVCDLLHLDASTLSRNVERMEAKGWLEVVPDEDGRAQPFRLTAAGRELLGRTVPAWRQAQGKAAAVLGQAGVGLLHEAAARLGLNPA